MAPRRSDPVPVNTTGLMSIGFSKVQWQLSLLVGADWAGPRPCCLVRTRHNLANNVGQKRKAKTTQKISWSEQRTERKMVEHFIGAEI